MRIALVSMHTSPVDTPGAGDVGGMNIVIRHVAERLAARGHTVEIFTRRTEPSAPAEVELAPGVVVRLLPAGPPEPRLKRDHESYIAPFAQRLGEHGPWDVIHSHHWFSGMSALPVARRLGVAHVQSFHSIAAEPTSPLAEGERPEGPGRLPGEKHLAAASDAVIAVSRAEADTAVRRLGAAPARVHVVPPGVDAAQFRPVESSGRPADPPERATGSPERAARPVLLVAARLEPLKGLDLAIGALADLPAVRRPLLVIAGGATAGFEGYDAQLRRLAGELGVSADVRFTGPMSRAELARQMRTVAAVLVPSHSETYGLVALEGAASGVPVIAQDTGGLREAIVDGVTGRLLHDREPATWAAAIDELLADPARAAKLGRNGRAHALRHGWDATAAGWLSVYRDRTAD